MQRNKVEKQQSRFSTLLWNKWKHPRKSYCSNIICCNHSQEMQDLRDLRDRKQVYLLNLICFQTGLLAFYTKMHVHHYDNKIVISQTTDMSGVWVKKFESLWNIKCVMCDSILLNSQVVVFFSIYPVFLNNYQCNIENHVNKSLKHQCNYFH